MSTYDYSIPDEDSIRYVRELLEKDEGNSYLKKGMGNKENPHLSWVG